MVSLQQAVWNDNVYRQRYWQLLDEFLFILTQMRSQTSLEQARQLALRSGLVTKFVSLCQVHGFKITQQQQVALMRLNPMALLAQCLSWRESPYNAKLIPLMGRDELDQQLTELVTSMTDDKALVNWLSFRNSLYTNGLIAAYEAKQQGDVSAALLNTADLALSCPGYQRAEVRQKAKKQNITAACYALASLGHLSATQAADVPKTLQRLSDQRDHRGYCKLLVVSQQPASFLHRLAMGGLKSILSLSFNGLSVFATADRSLKAVDANELERQAVACVG